MMHLCDTNVFIALSVQQHAHHHLATEWFYSLERSESLAFCRATQTSFLRLLTRKIAEHYQPQTNQQAWAVYDQLCQDDTIIFAEEPPGLEVLWRKLAAPGTASPKVWMDAYLAAFAIAANLRMVTLDQDFKSFEAAGLDLLHLSA